MHKERERICPELGNVEGLARSLANQASLLLYSRKRPRETLRLAEEACCLARYHGYGHLAERIRLIVDAIRASLQ